MFEEVESSLPAGYTLVELYHSADRTVVLAKRNEPVFPDCEYTTWEWGQYGGLFSGHYDLTKEKGHIDFLRRCE